MKKPVRRVRRIVRRSRKGKGKGRSKGKGRRRRLHGRCILAFLASLIGPQYEEVLLGTGRSRRQASGKGKERRGNPKDANSKAMDCDICRSAQHFRRECPRGDGRGRGPSIHRAQTDSDIQHVDWESLIVDFADGSATIVHSMAVRYLRASIALDSYADVLFKEVFTGHSDIDLA
eukprot:1960985-Pyramimonas_sp.AAC.1